MTVGLPLPQAVSTSAERMALLWAKYRRPFLIGSTLLLLLASIYTLGAGYWRLLFDPSRLGAVDLGQRFREVATWFSGGLVYDSWVASYPPATYLMLWPFLGWLNFTAARWLWAMTALPLLGALSWQVVRLCQPRDKLETAFLVSMTLSLLALRVDLANGQLSLHITPAIIAALLLLKRSQPSWRIDLAIAILMTWALVKPSYTAPFMWVVLFAARRWRPALLTALVYGLTTVVAAAFQPLPFPQLIAEWLQNVSYIFALDIGYANVHYWLNIVGVSQWGSLVSIGVFILFGVWVWRLANPEAFWPLVGLAGIVARIWTYHNVYDDLLILPALIALWQLARQKSSPHNVLPALLFAAVAFTTFDLTASASHRLTPFWQTWIGLVWIGGALYLAYEMYRLKPLKQITETG